MSGIDADKFPEIVCTTVLGARKRLAEAGSARYRSSLVRSTTPPPPSARAVADFVPHLYVRTSSWVAAFLSKNGCQLGAGLGSAPRGAIYRVAGDGRRNLTFLKTAFLPRRRARLAEKSTTSSR
jgi:hypothetical protein